MNQKIYDIDYSKFRQRLLPSFLRLPKWLAWVKCMTYPAVVIYQDFLRFRAAKNYQLLITPQVCYLERLLNDRFDSVERRIVIIDGEDKPPVFLFTEEEDKPVYLFTEEEEDEEPTFIYTEGEAGTITDDFIIKVPSDIVFEQSEMRSLVKAYKLAGTKFSIQID